MAVTQVAARQPAVEPTAPRNAGGAAALTVLPAPGVEVPQEDPLELCCPITLELFNDPVRTIQGRMYERHAVRPQKTPTPPGQSQAGQIPTQRDCKPDRITTMRGPATRPTDWLIPPLLAWSTGPCLTPMHTVSYACHSRPVKKSDAVSLSGYDPLARRSRAGSLAAT
jgi:hypothetical protein